MERNQALLDSGKLTESQSKGFQAELGRLKDSLDSQTAEAQSCQTAETEASGQLEEEKRKLAALQGRIEALDSALERISTSR